ncbi:tRNA (adenine(22)-N(1))-methyltransferase TrmK [Photobacterium japonica]|uniref:tRNA (adenine(22)-N(1))-methyltransferase n=1 Tax=Photobacterium japonica TaxID=2910235 RepID=UPI003D0C18F6
MQAIIGMLSKSPSGETGKNHYNTRLLNVGERPLKLSKRLKHIEQLITPGYTHIWDCCCDHGLLGTALLSRQAADNIHFVDIVPALMQAIDHKLQRFHADSLSTWKTHCLDVAALPLDQYEGKHLVIIAGVGGDLMTQFIESIHGLYPELEIDFLLCPVHHQFTLRQTLLQRNFSLKQECLVKENHRFYEIIYVSSTPDVNKKVSLVGEHIWQSTTDDQADIAAQYLAKTLKHYRRMQLGNTTNATSALKAYQPIVC